MRDKRISSTIVGIGQPKEVDGVAAWAKWPIPDAVWQEVSKLSVSRDDPEATRNYVAPQ